MQDYFGYELNTVHNKPDNGYKINYFNTINYLRGSFN